MANELSREQLHRLAKLGAHARLEELEAERRAILRAFPGLSAQAARQAAKADAAPGGSAGDTAPAAAEAAAKKGARPRKKMSPEQRKAASERMRKVWAERRKAAEA